MNNPFSKLLQFGRIKMNLKYIFFTSGLTFLIITAVKCWYRCAELTFCDKLRSRKASSFSLMVSGKLTSTLTGKLVNKDTRKYYDFFLTAFDGGKFSIYVDDPRNPRYRVKDSLAETPREILLTENATRLDVGDLVVLKFGEIKINLFTDPFNLTAYRGDKEFVRVNSRELLTFEEYPYTEVALDFVFPQALRAYGLPEHADQLSLRTTTTYRSDPYRLYNIDRYGYEVNSQEALYGSVPVLYAIGTNVSAGVFWMNSAQTFVDITNRRQGVESYFMSEAGSLHAFVLSGPTLQDCVKQYANLTGVAPLPQMFALGYHQSRYSYMNQVEVLNVCEKFDKNKFPLDAIWLDIDYTNGKKYFTWDPKAFPAPDIMLDSLEKQGRKAVAIIDPHIKRDTGYSVFDECETKGYFVKNSNGTVFQGSCWPGASSWIDFFNPEARNYYSTLISEFAKKKNLHIWNDMNEPSIFLVPEQAMNGSCVHYNNRTHQELHNQYGFYQTMATYEGLKEKPSKVRPFILTRSFFAGSQRFAAHWTGDNVAKWEHLKISIPMILTEALAGISFVGADIGGFAADPTDELLQRWYQAGAWYPFYRSHSFAETKRREPYLFKDEVKTRIRNSLQQRYRHLTHWYTLFWQHYQTGEPIIRPLSYHYNDNVNTFDIDDEFLVGADILIHPITDKGATNVTVYLPGGEHELWYNIDNFNNTYLGIGPVDFTVTLDTVPVFYKGGSIIPINHVVKKSTAYMKGDPITLLVFLDKKLYANGYVYDDDHESFNYLNKNYTYVNFTFKDNTLQSEIIDKDAWYNQPTFISSVVIYGYNGDISKIYIGKNTTTSSNEGVSVSIDFQKMYTCGTQKNNTVTLDNLNIDIRDPFVIKFNENIPK